MTSLSFDDFYKVPEIKFDINRLRNDLNLILEKMKSEIERDMILMACKTVKDLNRSKITFRKNSIK